MNGLIWHGSYISYLTLGMLEGDIKGLEGGGLLGCGVIREPLAGSLHPSNSRRHTYDAVHL